MNRGPARRVKNSSPGNRQYQRNFPPGSIKNFSHAGITRGTFDAVDPPKVGMIAFVFKRQQRGTFAREHRKCGHQRINNGDDDRSRTPILHQTERLMIHADQTVGGRMFTCPYLSRFHSSPRSSKQRCSKNNTQSGSDQTFTNGSSKSPFFSTKNRRPGIAAWPATSRVMLFHRSRVARGYLTDEEDRFTEDSEAVPPERFLANQSLLPPTRGR